MRGFICSSCQNENKMALACLSTNDKYNEANYASQSKHIWHDLPVQSIQAHLKTVFCFHTRPLDALDALDATMYCIHNTYTSNLRAHRKPHQTAHDRKCHYAATALWFRFRFDFPNMLLQLIPRR